MNSRIEKRRHPRIPLNWPVVLMTPQGPIKGETSNISAGGVLILFLETPDTGDEFEIILKPSEYHEMTVTCEKMWSGHFNIDGSVFSGIGVCFTEISSGDYEIIASLVAEQHS